MSTIARNGGIYKGAIFASNRTIWHLNCGQTNDLYKIELLEIELFDHLFVSIKKMCLQIKYSIYM